MEQNKEAEQAWTEKCTITSFKICSLTTDDRSMQIIEGSLLINDLLTNYRASLKEAIEHHMDKVSGDTGNPYINGRTLALKKCLELLDTVKPNP